jgi:GNAT superfamily N-acetyltransferase
VPITAADRDAVAALFARCSAETRRLRFFGNVLAMPPGYLTDVLAEVPGQHDAVGAWRGRELVGLASLAADTPDSGELAVLVDDAHQRRGVGTRMIATLIARARVRGVTTVTASVLPGRTELLTRLGRHWPVEGIAAGADGVRARYRIGAEA